MTSILTWYRRRFLRNDAILAIILTGVIWYYGPLISELTSKQLNYSQIVATTITVMGQFASIFIASLAIVAGFVDSKHFDDLRKLDWFPDIWRFLSISASVFVIGIILGLLTLALGVESLVAFCFLGVSIFVFLEVYRCIRLLYLLISIINDKRVGSCP